MTAERLRILPEWMLDDPGGRALFRAFAEAALGARASRRRDS